MVGLGALGPSLTAVSLVRATLVAPLAEEMLFRGAMFGWLRSRLSGGPTIVITASLFAVIHGLPVFLPLAFGLGLGLGWVRERSHSIVAGLAFRVLHNSTLFLLVYLFAGWSFRHASRVDSRAHRRAGRGRRLCGRPNMPAATL